MRTRIQTKSKERAEIKKGERNSASAGAAEELFQLRRRPGGVYPLSYAAATATSFKCPAAPLQIHFFTSFSSPRIELVCDDDSR